jgi:hypothetical protein
MEKAVPGNRKVSMGYGKALFTQKGGWTVGELTESTERKKSDFNRADFEEVPDKHSQPEKKFDGAS